MESFLKMGGHFFSVVCSLWMDIVLPMNSKYSSVFSDITLGFQSSITSTSVNQHSINCVCDSRITFIILAICGCLLSLLSRLQCFCHLTHTKKNWLKFFSRLNDAIPLKPLNGHPFISEESLNKNTLHSGFKVLLFETKWKNRNSFSCENVNTTHRKAFTIKENRRSTSEW